MKSKIFISFLSFVLTTLIVGTALATGANMLAGEPAVSAVGTSAVVGFMRMGYYALFSFELNQASFFAGVNKEIWLDYLSENFYRTGSFLQNVMDWSPFVEYNTLNFADAGGDPTVLVDNTTYPIDTAQRTDTAKTIALQTYDTENTRVRNVEEMESAYNKMDSVIRQHRNALIQSTHDRAIHAYGPASDAANTPVLLTGGEATAALLTEVGLTGTFKKFSLKDIARLKVKFDLADWPVDGRVLVLHPMHQMDLIEENQNLFKAFAELRTGKVLDLYGFKILNYSANPVYTESTGAKKAFGAAASAANDTIASVAFLETEVMKAEGDQEMFYMPKSLNTTQRADEVGFQKRFVAVPIRGVSTSAIISDRTAA
ncbi:MAG: hypothetical protein ABJL71_19075 [Cyclobacteriaceae bacterium]